jgi:hypothetical protein
MKKFESYIKEQNESIECVINKIKVEFMNDNDCGWEHFVDNQKMGDCQSIVSSIMYYNIPGIEKHFGEIEVNFATEVEYEGKIMTHHWVTYKGKVLEFSKGTLKEYVDWSDKYSIEDDGEVNYDGGEIIFR